MSELSVREFVRDTLVQIVNGAMDAQNTLLCDAHINPGHRENIQLEPTDVTDSALGVKRPVKTFYRQKAQDVKFDLIVTTDSQKTAESSGGGGVRVSVLSIGREAKDSDAVRHAQANRITFTVPIAFGEPGNDIEID